MVIAIIGYGSRGKAYADIYKESATVAAVCDINPERLELAKKELNLDDSQLFSNEADFFAAGKFGELCVVSSPDNCHKRHAQAAMSLGYDLHLEKPIACTKEDCRVVA